jgi:hypothetical protein
VDIWGEIFADFFCAGKVRFCWGFREIGVLDVVFLWTVCGELCGEDGLRMGGF